MQAHLLERAGDTSAALGLLGGQLQAAAQALLQGILAGRVPVEQLQPSLHFRAFMQVWESTYVLLGTASSLQVTEVLTPT